MAKYEYYEGEVTGCEYKPGISFSYKIAVPDVKQDEYALLVEHDGLNDANANAMLQLANEGKAPFTICLGIEPGYIRFSDGSKRDMRMNCYDLFDREYGDFIVYEFIPYIVNRYGIKLSDSPDMHMVSGGSSGGISSFVIAWYHSDYFHRVYMASPSFLAMGRGNEIPCLIRKCETKPLRVYLEYSEYEPDDYFGSSYTVAIDAARALAFAKYDYKCKYFPGEGHCSRCLDEKEAYERNEWLWANWKTEKLKANSNSDRVNKVVPISSKWERCDALPRKENATKPGLPEKYDIILKSADEKLWYVANRGEGFVYAFFAEKDHLPKKALLHAMLHTAPREVASLIDMDIDKCDRLYVLTKMGIQCVRSYGLIDAILDLPDDSTPLEIVIVDALYIKTANGIYRRSLCNTEVEAGRRSISYYD